MTLAGAVLLGSALPGCGGSSDTPELGRVYGTITLDGQPLPDASVRFQPLEGGRPAMATTNDSGYYELQYTESAPGAVLGKHVVRIFTRRAGYDDGDEFHPAVPEKVPARYNRGALDNPEMTVEIKPGSNEVNFELTSQGDIVQPESGLPAGRR